ncbi:MAG: topoisomerase DNA-binding C4 zinc finger domain-containing protein, partial [Syntrophomonadaceae bacterium]|nr:topoisomerase DNA-binding C4 zinc finger domain-containing protein [Syntrophomonadaceae bacterium]
CSGFPECRYTESINEDVGVQCPLCGGSIIALKSKKGRKFYGCSNYPECSFRSWNKPTGEKCPDCGEVMVEKNNKSGKNIIICQNPKCRHQKKVGG